MRDNLMIGRGYMEEPITPEEDLDQELHKQERDLHGHLFHINQLFMICCDESLSCEEMYQKCQPTLNKLMKGNPLVAQEVEHLIKSGNRQELMDYFEKEKQQLAQVLGDEMNKHKSVSKQINDQKMDRQPTDS